MATLKTGSKGSEVKKLQEKLNKAPGGGAKLKLDGVFGPKTEEAVKAFQKRRKLKADGAAGRKTFEALDAGKQKITLDIGNEDYDTTSGAMGMIIEGVHYRHNKYEDAIDRSADAAAQLERTLRRRIEALRKAKAPYVKIHEEYKTHVDRIAKNLKEFEKLSKAGTDTERLKDKKIEIERLHKLAQITEAKKLKIHKEYKAVLHRSNVEVREAQKRMEITF